MRLGSANRSVEPGSGTAEVALTRREHLRLADVLLRAAGDRTPIVPLSKSYPELTAADAARIRDAAIVRRIASGARIIGAKVSLGATRGGGDTRPAPRLGWLTDDMQLSSPVVDLGGLIRPRIEAKVGFVLGERLRSRIAGVGDLLELTERVVPCLEVLDARYAANDVDLVDDIADNCAASALLMGTGVPTPPEEQLLAARVRLSCSAPAPTFAHGISPVAATLWLANRVIAEGGELEPGALLLSSACDRAIEPARPARASADFGVLGRLELEVSG